MANEMSAAVEEFPSLRDKSAVELVSRIRVVKDHVGVQEGREDFLNQISDFFTGKGHRRQIQVNKNLSRLMEINLEWIHDLTKKMALGHRAINELQKSLKQVQGYIQDLGEISVQLDMQIKELERIVDERMSELESRINEVDYRERARAQLDRVMHRWIDGVNADLPPGLGLFSVMDELWWGDFGFYCNRFQGKYVCELREYLRERVEAHLVKFSGGQREERIARADWFGESRLDIEEQAVRFLGDWTDSHRTPYAWGTVNRIGADVQINVLPYVFSGERYCKAMEREFFDMRDAG